MSRRRYNFNLPEELHGRVRVAAGDVPLSRWVERALEAALERQPPVARGSAGEARRPGYEGFSPRVSPKGFAGSVPKGGDGSVRAMVDRIFGGE